MTITAVLWILAGGAFLILASGLLLWLDQRDYESRAEDPDWPDDDWPSPRGRRW